MRTTGATRSTRTLLSAVLVAASLGGCGTSQWAPSASGGGTITVFAGQALRSVFGRIGEQFHTENSTSYVALNYGFSPYLVTELTRGAHADVFASGNASDMDQVAHAGLLAADPVRYATNKLAILVASGNPKKVVSFTDLNRPDLKVAVCAKEAREPGTEPVAGLPCGSALDSIEQATGVRLPHATEVPRTEDVLQKVINGDVDAGVAFASDAALGAASVTTVPFPEAAATIITYSIAVLKGSKNPELARRFVGFVAGQVGQSILSADGFAAVN
jgi:molybdate transport system substrate-binding protein